MSEHQADSTTVLKDDLFSSAAFAARFERSTLPENVGGEARFGSDGHCCVDVALPGPSNEAAVWMRYSGEELPHRPENATTREEPPLRTEDTTTINPSSTMLQASDGGRDFLVMAKEHDGGEGHVEDEYSDAKGATHHRTERYDVLDTTGAANKGVSSYGAAIQGTQKGLPLAKVERVAELMAEVAELKSYMAEDARSLEKLKSYIMAEDVRSLEKEARIAEKDARITELTDKLSQIRMTSL